MPILLGLPRHRQIRFTLRFRRTITMADERCRARRAHRLTVSGIGAGMSGVGKSKRRNRPRRLERGTRASANTSGPDFTWSRNPGEIADARDPHERRKPVSSAGPASHREYDPAVDLMSRRHPLSSIRAGTSTFAEANSRCALQ